MLGVQRSLVSNPTPVYLLAAALLGFFALSLSPSFIPVILLLAVLRLFLNVVFSYQLPWPKIQLGIATVAGAATLSNYGSTVSAVPEVPVLTALSSMFWLSFVVSGLAFTTIIADMSFRSSVQQPSAQLVLFPTIWATVLCVVSRFSPLGYLSSWSPTLGVSAYSWLRPYLGPLAIDWVVGAWAVVLSEVSGMWIMGEKKEAQTEELLIHITDDDQRQDFIKPVRSRWLIGLSILLCFGALPSYLYWPLPAPVNSETTFPLLVSCALPFVEDFHREPSFDEYIHETSTLVPLAKVILWPEGAVQFPTAENKAEAIGRIQKVASGSVVGVSFIDQDNSTGSNNMMRNGFMLIDRDGLMFEYYKRHLVPFVESNIMVPSYESPKLVEYQLAVKYNSRKKPIELLPVPITASICLDFASRAPFAELDRQPSLILGPSRTWHPGAGIAMWEQAKARAEEVGSALLWCDGGPEGLSGIAGHGTGPGELVQVGRGSWVRSIGLNTQFSDARTMYGKFVDWPALALIWCTFGLEWVVKQLVGHVRGEKPLNINVDWRRINPTLQSAKEAFRFFMKWKQSRQTEGGERAHLL